MQLRRLNKMAKLATLFAVTVVMLGAWTRLVDAGLGCPDWPGCYGFLTVPQTPEKIAIAEARFPESPVEVHKGWPEMIHRYFASTLGLLIIIMTVIAWRAKQHQTGQSIETIPLGHCVGLLALVICQGLFGMWTVTLKLWPQVVSAHLLGGFATLSLLFLLTLRTGFRSPILSSLSSQRLSQFKRFALIALALTIAQIFLGAWTASNYAAVACGTEFPGCHNSLWPPMDLAEGFNFFQTIGPNYLGGLVENDARVAIHYMHRLGALVLSIYLLTMLVWMYRNTDARAIQFSVIGVGLILAVQLLLGISNVIWLVPLKVAVAHNAVGALLLLSIVNLLFQLYRTKANHRAAIQ